MAGAGEGPGIGWYVEPTLIRALGTIEYVACRTPDGEARVLVCARPGVSPADSGPLIAEIARVHRLLDVPGVPTVAEIDDAAQPSFVALACDGIADLETLIVEVIAERDEPRAPPDHPRYEVSFSGGAAHTIIFLEQLALAHRTIDPTTGKPVCLGAISAASFLAAEDGRVWTVGWGHPWRGAQRAQLLGDAPVAFLAPESAFGVAPSPGSDLSAATLYFHSSHRLGELPPAIKACFAGEIVAPELAERVSALMLNAHAPRPDDRSIARFLDDFRPALVLLGIEADETAFARDLRAAIALMRARARAGGGVAVATDGRWYQPPGGPAVSLERRGAMRKLVLALATARRDAPGAPLSWEDLLRAGWPSESPRVEAAKNRVYVAVAQLRALGLRDVLLRHDSGYLLDPAVPLAWSDGPTPPDAR